jgi:ankyrin repeat protein
MYDKIMINQSTLLAAAIEKGDLSAIQEMIKNSANCDWLTLPFSDGITSLMFAVKKKKATIFSYLVEEVAKKTGQDKATLLKKENGFLHWAVARQSLDIVNYLLENGANVNATLESSLLGAHVMPLHVAAYLNNEKIINLLLKHGANYEAKVNGKRADELSTHNASPNILNQKMEEFLTDIVIKHMREITQGMESPQQTKLLFPLCEGRRTVLHLVAVKYIDQMVPFINSLRKARSQERLSENEPFTSFQEIKEDLFSSHTQEKWRLFQEGFCYLLATERFEAAWGLFLEFSDKEPAILKNTPLMVITLVKYSQYFINKKSPEQQEVLAAKLKDYSPVAYKMMITFDLNSIHNLLADGNVDRAALAEKINFIQAFYPVDYLNPSAKLEEDRIDSSQLDFRLGVEKRVPGVYTLVQEDASDKNNNAENSSAKSIDRVLLNELMELVALAIIRTDNKGDKVDEFDLFLQTFFKEYECPPIIEKYTLNLDQLFVTHFLRYSTRWENYAKKAGQTLFRHPLFNNIARVIGYNSLVEARAALDPCVQPSIIKLQNMIKVKNQHDETRKSPVDINIKLRSDKNISRLYKRLKVLDEKELEFLKLLQVQPFYAEHATSSKYLKKIERQGALKSVRQRENREHFFDVARHTPLNTGNDDTVFWGPRLTPRSNVPWRQSPTFSLNLLEHFRTHPFERNYWWGSESFYPYTKEQNLPPVYLGRTKLVIKYRKIETKMKRFLEYTHPDGTQKIEEFNQGDEVVFGQDIFNFRYLRMIEQLRYIDIESQALFYNNFKNDNFRNAWIEVLTRVRGFELHRSNQQNINILKINRALITKKIYKKFVYFGKVPEGISKRDLLNFNYACDFYGHCEFMSKAGARKLVLIRNLLSHAVNENDLKKCKELLDSGADPSISDDSWLTPIFIASAKNRSEMARLLLYQSRFKNNANLSYPVDVNRACEGELPIEQAILNRNCTMIQLLVDNGCLDDKETFKIANKKNKDDYPLFFSVYFATSILDEYRSNCKDENEYKTTPSQLVERIRASMFEAEKLLCLACCLISPRFMQEIYSRDRNFISNSFFSHFASCHDTIIEFDAYFIMQKLSKFSRQDILDRMSSKDKVVLWNKAFDYIKDMNKTFAAVSPALVKDLIREIVPALTWLLTDKVVYARLRNNFIEKIKSPNFEICVKIENKFDFELLTPFARDGEKILVILKKIMEHKDLYDCFKRQLPHCSMAQDWVIQYATPGSLPLQKMTELLALCSSQPHAVRNIVRKHYAKLLEIFFANKEGSRFAECSKEAIFEILRLVILKNNKRKQGSVEPVELFSLLPKERINEPLVMGKSALHLAMETRDAVLIKEICIPQFSLINTETIVSIAMYETAFPLEIIDYLSFLGMDPTTLNQKGREELRRRKEELKLEPLEALIKLALTDKEPLAIACLVEGRNKDSCFLNQLTTEECKELKRHCDTLLEEKYPDGSMLCQKLECYLKNDGQHKQDCLLNDEELEEAETEAESYFQRHRPREYIHTAWTLSVAYLLRGELGMARQWVERTGTGRQPSSLTMPINIKHFLQRKSLQYTLTSTAFSKGIKKIKGVTEVQTEFERKVQFIKDYMKKDERLLDALEAQYQKVNAVIEGLCKVLIKEDKSQDIIAEMKMLVSDYYGQDFSDPASRPHGEELIERLKAMLNVYKKQSERKESQEICDNGLHTIHTLLKEPLIPSPSFLHRIFSFFGGEEKSDAETISSSLSQKS